MSCDERALSRSFLSHGQFGDKRIMTSKEHGPSVHGYNDEGFFHLLKTSDQGFSHRSVLATGCSVVFSEFCREAQFSEIFYLCGSLFLPPEEK